MTKYEIDPATIGRLEVGTKTIVDKSKSVKTVLMQLFPDNTDIEGILLKTFSKMWLVVRHWHDERVLRRYSGIVECDSLDWKLRVGRPFCFGRCWVQEINWTALLTRCSDIAVYASGNARPTGGAGVIAMLVGPNAPIVFERGKLYILKPFLDLFSRFAWNAHGTCLRFLQARLVVRVSWSRWPTDNLMLPASSWQLLPTLLGQIRS